jgi:alpha-tubulin suppressor-like RCC1 family protein
MADHRSSRGHSSLHVVALDVGIVASRFATWRAFASGAGGGRTATILLRPTALAFGILLGLACGCFSPRRPDCVVSCGADSSCPNGMTCSAGLCTAGASCVSSISAGETHSCAARAGAVYCWGGNRYGQLGGPPSGSGASDTQSVSGEATPRVASIADSARPVTAVAAGGRHTCALGAGGQVFCWGVRRATLPTRRCSTIATV